MECDIMEDTTSKITLGCRGDVVEIDVGIIGPSRGYRLATLLKNDKTPSYFTDIILTAAEGHVTPHEIDSSWIEENVEYIEAINACKTIITRTTTKNHTSPVKST